MPAARLLHVLRRLSPKRAMELPRAWAAFRSPWRAVAAYVGLRRIGTPELVVCRAHLAFAVTGQDDLVTLWGVFVRRDYPVRGDERLIVDAGANFGAFSLYAARRAPDARIVALEPVVATRDRLARHVELHRLEDRIRVMDAGVAGATGERTIRVGAAGTYASFWGGTDRAAETVKALSLADLLRAIGDPERVDLMKMDCEGAEMEAILGADDATLRRIRRIALEYHTFAGFRPEDVFSKLISAGFRLVRHAPDPAHASGLAEFTLDRPA